MSYATQIANFTSLDESTVNSQIIPFLETFSDPVRLQAHLQDLLGTKPQVRHFISTYIAYRFPSLASSSSSSPSISAPSSRPASRGPTASGGRSGSSTPLPLGGKPIIKQAKKQPRAAAGGGVVSDLMGGSAKAVKPSEPTAVSSRCADGLPKSAEVERIEGLMKNVDLAGPDGEGLGKRALKKGRNGGCFCQARIHPISHYTPLCLSCSLPLCALQLPHLPCPSCGSHLLTPSNKIKLLATLEAERAKAIQRERAERERIAEEAKEKAWTESGGGRFPTLASGVVAGTGSGTSVKPPVVDTGRKVLSLNPKTGRAKVQTFVNKPAPPPEPKKRADKPVEEEDSGRIGPPLMVYLGRNERISCCEEILARRREAGRFFWDVMSGTEDALTGGLELVYREKKVKIVNEGDLDGESRTEGGEGGEKKKGKKRGRGKGKGKDKTEGDAVPGIDANGTAGEASEGRERTGMMVSYGMDTGNDGAPSSVAGLEDLTLEERAFLGLSTPATPRQQTNPSKPNSATPSFQPAHMTRQAPPHIPSSASVPRYSTSNPPPSRVLKAGVRVLLIQKQDQPTGKTTEGEIKDVLTSGDHPRGVKIRCRDGTVGRVVGLL